LSGILEQVLEVDLTTIFADGFTISGYGNGSLIGHACWRG
jgi:hypothetical protein